MRYSCGKRQYSSCPYFLITDSSSRARATSAAPSYFKPLRSPRNGKGYVDGALYHNNPVQLADFERKLLWPDTLGFPPDVLVSVGTACKDKLELDRDAKNNLNMADDVFKPKQINVKKSRLHYKSGTRLVIKSAKMLQNRMNSVLDTERAWHSFLATISNGNASITGRFYRVNPAIGWEPPSLDDTSRLEDLQKGVRESLHTIGMAESIREIAERLVATSFFFEKRQAQANTLICHG
jgi:hypothetical protein